MEVGFADSYKHKKPSLQPVFDFLRQHKSIIDRKEFEVLYLHSEDYLFPAQFITYVLLNSDIDPLQYITQIFVRMYSGLDINSIDIPENVKAIRAFAFANCFELKRVKLPKTLERIHSHAFEDCAVESIKLPTSLNYISDGAFAFCSNLKVIRYNATGDEFKKIYPSWSKDLSKGCEIICKDTTLVV